LKLKIFPITCRLGALPLDYRQTIVFSLDSLGLVLEMYHVDHDFAANNHDLCVSYFTHLHVYMSPLISTG